jgi:hypothetical protein
MKFCASSGGGRELEAAFASLKLQDPTTKPTAQQPSAGKATEPPARTSGATRMQDSDRPGDLPIILMAMRKLREGILGSRRRDRFAQRAYIFVIHASILTRSWESYQPALLYLLYHIHPHAPLSEPELDEFAGYYVLDLACRQYELAEAYAIKLQFKLRDRKVENTLRALVQDDWVRFWRTLRAVDGYQRAIVDFAAERIRLHALKCLGRSYMSADRSFVERAGGGSFEELVEGGVGWQLQEDGVVIIRKPKPK